MPATDCIWALTMAVNIKKIDEAKLIIKEMKEKLGEGLCLAKWQQVSLHLPTGLTNSCYHPPLHQIDSSLLESNPSALHNTPYKKEQRKLMLSGQRPTECQYCWK